MKYPSVEGRGAHYEIPIASRQETARVSTSPAYEYRRPKVVVERVRARVETFSTSTPTHRRRRVRLVPFGKVCIARVTGRS